MKRVAFKVPWISALMIGLTLVLGTRAAAAQQCPSPPVATVDLTSLQNAVTAAQNALANAEFIANNAIQEMLAAGQALYQAQMALSQAQRSGIGVASAAAAVRAAQIAYSTALAAADQARAAVTAAQGVLQAAETALANAIAASGLTAAQLACYGILITEAAVLTTECVLIKVSYDQYCAAGGTNFTGEVCANYWYYCNPLNWSNPFR